MEDFDTIDHNTRAKTIGLVVVDPMVAIHFMRNRNFRIVHVSKLLSSNSKKEFEELDIYEKEKPPWVTNDHRSEIATFLDICSDEPILECHIEIEGGIDFIFSGAELYIQYKRIHQLADAIKIILNYHGYYAVDKIWNYVSSYSAHYDIASLKFLTTEQITDEMLDLMLASGVKYLEHGRIDLEESEDEKEANNLLNRNLN